MARAGGNWLLFAVNATGGVSSYRISDPGAPLVQVQGRAFPSNLTYHARPSLTVLDTAAGNRLLVEGMSGAGVAGLSFGAAGTLGGIAQLFPAERVGARLSASAEMTGTAGRFLFSARQDSLVLEVNRINGDGSLAPVSSVTLPRPAGVTEASLDKIILMTVDGQRLLVAMSGLGNFVSVHAVGDKGTLGKGAMHVAGEGTGAYVPSDIAAIQFGGASFVVVAGATSSSLSVFRVGRTGALTTTDHVVDELTTRFQSVTAVATAVVDGRGFVIAGGADGGISVFTLLPNGRLLHLQNIVDTKAMTLARISAIEAQVIDGRIVLFVTSGGETGVTQLEIDPGAIGTTGIARTGTMTGTAHDDLLVGAAATAGLRGGAGDDILVSGNGNITLSGGAGADIFAITRHDGRVVISDYEPGVDRLDLSMLGMIRSTWQLSFAPQSWGMRIVYGNSILEIRTRSGDGLLPTHFGNGMFPIGHYWLPKLDPVTVAPPSATVGKWIFGGEGADRLQGAGGPDVIRAGAGNDTVSGAAGADTVQGQAGRDQLRGGDGADQLSGSTGNDTVFGDAGNDSVLGQDGDDLLYGGSGRDMLQAGRGDDYAHGGRGTDRLLGESGNDTLSGDEDGDWLEDRWGNNHLIGGTGNDMLISGAGLDRILGGDGSDTLQGGAASDWLEDVLGNNRFYGESGNDIVTAGPGIDLLRGGGGQDSLRAGSGNDRVLGEDGNDRMFGDAGNDLLDGGAGNDWLYGGTGKDRLDGAAGHDTLQGQDGDDALTDLRGNNRLLGESGNDTLRAGARVDRLFGGTGNDVLFGGAGNDPLSGDAGNDRLLGEAGDDNLQDLLGHTFMDGGLGSDRLVAGGGRDTLLGGSGNDGIRAGAGNDRLDGGTGNDTLFGDAGNDTLADLLGNNILSGGTGNDALTGGTGIDRLDGGSGNDLLRGGPGNDRLSGQTGSDGLRGDEGSDTLSGDAGGDTLSGGSGNDLLQGGAGRDRLWGGKGADVLAGGAEADVFRFMAVSDSTRTMSDVIRDFAAGADDLDLRGMKLDFIDNAAFSAARQVRYRHVHNETQVLADLNGDRQAEFMVRLLGRHDLDADDFLL